MTTSSSCEFLIRSSTGPENTACVQYTYTRFEPRFLSILAALTGVPDFFFFSSRRRHTRSLCDWSQTCALPILQRPTNAADLIRVFVQVAQGLGAMHKLGYV